ncbi:MAG: hypothetical protein HRT94_02830 [Alphaproteobacteria bacterium]|nr:hypothetical protein [Alphaproteobacteria bacterium]
MQDDQDNSLDMDDDLAFDDLGDDLDFDDDFGLEDDESLLDDLPDELLGETEGQSAETPAPVSSDKKGLPLSFNTIVIGGAVILGIGVFAFQVMGSKQKQTTAQEQRFVSSLGLKGATETIVSQDEAEGTQPTSTTSATDVTQSEGGFLNDMEPDFPEEALVDISEPEALPMPTPIVEEAPPAAVQDRASITDSLEFLTEIEVENDIPKNPVSEVVEVMDDQIVDVVAQQDSILTNNQKQPDAVQESVLNRIDDKLGTFEERFEELDQKITAIEEGSNQRVAVLEDAVSGLEKKVGSIKSAERRPVRNTSPAQTSKINKPKSSSAQWELKAAQPGKAWISQKGKSNIQPVLVGDKVAGVGRIQSIQMSGSKWVITGSEGKITQ